MEILKQIGDSTTALVTTLVAAIVGGWLGIQQVLKVHATTKRDITVTDGETQIVQLLRQEMGRLSEANQRLMEDVQRLHGQVVLLQGENSKLKSLVETLTEKVSSYGG